MFLIKLWKKYEFGQNFWKISIFVKFSKNFNFRQILQNYFGILEKISILVKIIPNFQKNSHFVKFKEKISILINFGRNLRKISIFFSKSLKTFDFSQIFENFEFGQIFRNWDFGQIFEKKFDFGQNLRKFQRISHLAKFIEKKFDFNQFWSKFSINFDFLESSKTFDFSQIFENFKKIQILSILEKFPF